jgi:hypothetical protein
MKFPKPTNKCFKVGPPFSRKEICPSLVMLNYDPFMLLNNFLYIFASNLERCIPV